MCWGLSFGLVMNMNIGKLSVELRLIVSDNLDSEIERERKK